MTAASAGFTAIYCDLNLIRYCDNKAPAFVAAVAVRVWSIGQIIDTFGGLPVSIFAGLARIKV